MTEQTIEWNGGRWTRAVIEREIAAYQGYLRMAKQEVAAGQANMRPYAESYALHLDELLLLKSRFDAMAQS